MLKIEFYQMLKKSLLSLIVVLLLSLTVASAQDPASNGADDDRSWFGKLWDSWFGDSEPVRPEPREDIDPPTLKVEDDQAKMKGVESDGRPLEEGEQKGWLSRVWGSIFGSDEEEGPERRDREFAKRDEIVPPKLKVHEQISDEESVIDDLSRIDVIVGGQGGGLGAPKSCADLRAEILMIPNVLAENLDKDRVLDEENGGFNDRPTQEAVDSAITKLRAFKGCFNCPPGEELRWVSGSCQGKNGYLLIDDIIFWVEELRRSGQYFTMAQTSFYDKGLFEGLKQCRWICAPGGTGIPPQPPEGKIVIPGETPGEVSDADLDVLKGGLSVPAEQWESLTDADLDVLRDSITEGTTDEGLDVLKRAARVSDVDYGDLLEMYERMRRQMVERARQDSEAFDRVLEEESKRQAARRNAEIVELLKLLKEDDFYSCGAGLKDVKGSITGTIERDFNRALESRTSGQSQDYSDLMDKTLHLEACLKCDPPEKLVCPQDPDSGDRSGKQFVGDVRRFVSMIELASPSGLTASRKQNIKEGMKYFLDLLRQCECKKPTDCERMGPEYFEDQFACNANCPSGNCDRLSLAAADPARARQLGVSASRRCWKCTSGLQADDEAFRAGAGWNVDQFPQDRREPLPPGTFPDVSPRNVITYGSDGTWDSRPSEFKPLEESTTGTRPIPSDTPSVEPPQTQPVTTPVDALPATSCEDRLLWSAASCPSHCTGAKSYCKPYEGCYVCYNLATSADLRTIPGYPFLQENQLPAEDWLN